MLPAVKDGPKTLRKGQARTESIVADIPQWSKKSLRRHTRKVKENLKLLQQGKEEEAEIIPDKGTGRAW